MINCVTVVVNGQKVPGHLIEGRTYARLRDVAENLGARVTWNAGTWTAVVDQLVTPGPDMDLRLPGGATAGLLDRYLAGTPMADLGKAFVAAESKWRVSALFMCALGVHESNFGRSAIARDKNNLFGWGAADSDPYGQAWTFDSFSDCIDTVTGHISILYLNPRGRFYTSPTPRGMNRYYATDPEWAEKILRHMNAAVGIQV